MISDEQLDEWELEAQKYTPITNTCPTIQTFRLVSVIQALRAERTYRRVLERLMNAHAQVLNRYEAKDQNWLVQAMSTEALEALAKKPEGLE